MRLQVTTSQMEGLTFLPVRGSNWNPISKGSVYAMARGLQTASRVPAFTSLVTTIPRPLPANREACYCHAGKLKGLCSVILCGALICAWNIAAVT